jgi:hypothetical protein
VYALLRHRIAVADGSCTAFLCLVVKGYGRGRIDGIQTAVALLPLLEFTINPIHRRRFCCYQQKLPTLQVMLLPTALFIKNSFPLQNPEIRRWFKSMLKKYRN